LSHGPPVRLDLTSRGLSGTDADRVVAHLEAGGLVIYPTETVYGLGSTPEGPGMEALRAAKGGRKDRPVLLALADRQQAGSLTWSRGAEALAVAFWPGPLTLVLPDPAEAFAPGVRSTAGGVAVRVSSHPVPRELARALGRPLTSSSANEPGQTPVRDGAEAMVLAARIQESGPPVWVLDGGVLEGTPPSTLVGCLGEAVRILREGEIPMEAVLEVLASVEGGADDALPPEQPARAAGHTRILLVCSGNTCRSPLAAVLMKDIHRRTLVAGEGREVEVRSAGTGAVSGEPASRGSREAAARHGLCLEGHRSTHLDADLVGWADLILTMSPHHLARVAALGGEDRGTLISAFAAGSDNPFDGPPVGDPFGGDDETYEATYLELEALVTAVLEHLTPALNP